MPTIQWTGIGFCMAAAQASQEEKAYACPWWYLAEGEWWKEKTNKFEGGGVLNILHGQKTKYQESILAIM